MKLTKFSFTFLLALSFLGLNLNAKDSYDYTTDMAIANSIINPKILEDDIKSLQKKCATENNEDYCLAAERNKVILNKGDFEKFYTKTVPEYCYKKKVMGACKIIATDLIAAKLYREKDEHYVIKAAKEIIADKEATNMLKFGCEKLSDKGQCTYLSLMYAELGDMDNAKKYGALKKKATKGHREFDVPAVKGYDSGNHYYIYREKMYGSGK
ncbi:hypothetical protein [Campylobacter sp. RM16188]|uniref:hypothetical protein n=1 Tax=Campylobacter sp. RM16188 TaxID=1705725 RepID=UPI001557B0D3|nr:hypothetical protein [Campylobacter sp. RM16188]